MSVKDKIKDCSRTCLQPTTVRITHLNRFPREAVVTFLFKMIVHSSRVVGNILNFTHFVAGMVYRIIIQSDLQCHTFCLVSSMKYGIVRNIHNVSDVPDEKVDAGTL